LNDEEMIIFFNGTIQDAPRAFKARSARCCGARIARVRSTRDAQWRYNGEATIESVVTPYLVHLFKTCVRINEGGRCRSMVTTPDTIIKFDKVGFEVISCVELIFEVTLLRRGMKEIR